MRERRGPGGPEREEFMDWDNPEDEVIEEQEEDSCEIAPDDHRRFNRHGEEFDRGETFSGVPYEVGLVAVEQLRPLVPRGSTMAQFALRWILMFDAVTCAIPGAKTDAQARENVAAASCAPLDAGTLAEAEAIYDRFIRPYVHAHW